MMNSRIESRRTPIDHAYATCDRTCAKLLIYPIKLRHEEITRILGVQPSEAQNVGDSILTIKGTTRLAKNTFWMLSSEKEVVSKDIRAHLDWLLDRLLTAATGLQELQSSSANKMAVSCIWWSRYGEGGPTLWPEQMRKLCDLNLECTFDVGFYPE